MESCLNKTLVQAVLRQFRMDASSVHGPSHWLRVRYNGLLLAEHSGANPHIVELFSLFHDSCRENDRRDYGHGERGGLLAKQLFNRGLLDCSVEELQVIVAACDGHTDGTSHSEANIATCWDADRLDLPRVGIGISAEFLSTEWAKQAEFIAAASVRARNLADHLHDIPGLFWAL